MSPEQRKCASETLLHKRGIRINLQLPLTEEDEEVSLRSADALAQRMVALWAVAAAAEEPDSMRWHDYFAVNGIASWLSPQESAFLRGDDRDEHDFPRFAAKRESLYFLAWCAGLIETIQIPSGRSDVHAIAHFFPQSMAQPAALRNAIRLRARKEIMDWADLLYRLHWAVRHAGLIGKPMVGKLDGEAIRQWHQAVNWITNYEEEDNWDHVSTET